MNKQRSVLLTLLVILAIFQSDVLLAQQSQSLENLNGAKQTVSIVLSNQLDHGSAPVKRGRIVTGKPGSPIENTELVWSDVARHLYSKIQPWNCDESLLWLVNQDNQRTQIFYDGSGENIEFIRTAPGTELRWLPGSKYQMLFVNNNSVGIWHVNSNETDILTEFSSLSKLRIGPYEGNLSRDGRWVVLSGFTNDSLHTPKLRSLVYDIKNKRVHSSFEHVSRVAPDWISISASGRFIVENGIDDANRNDTTQVYDINFNPIGERWLSYGRPSHFDLTLDRYGDDIAVGVSKSKPDDGNLIKRRLHDGKIESLVSVGYARHTSARSLSTDNWVLATYEGQLSNWPPFSNELVAVSLNHGGVKRVLTYERHIENYWTQAQAVISPTGSLVAWAQESSDDVNPSIGLAVANSGLLASNEPVANLCKDAG